MRAGISVMSFIFVCCSVCWCRDFGQRQAGGFQKERWMPVNFHVIVLYVR